MSGALSVAGCADVVGASGVGDCGKQFIVADQFLYEVFEVLIVAIVV